MSIIGYKTRKQLVAMVDTKARELGIKKARAREKLAVYAIKKAFKHRERLQRQGGWTFLSWGMGVDSTAIILAFLEEGLEALGINPDKFVIITSQVGNEFPDLKPLIEKHILPRLRAAGIRFIQIARADESTTGYEVLSDTTKPKTLHLEGRFTVRDQYVGSGIVPQFAGEHLCSIKSKANPLGELVEDITQGENHLLILGYEAEEKKRALKASYQGTPARIPWFPLIEWDWDRKACIEYIHAMTGVWWVKSACWFCPFAGQGKEKDELAIRWALFPHLGADSLLMEYMALALNPRQTLFAKKSAWAWAEERELHNVLASYEHQLEKAPWAIYRLRRIWSEGGKAQRGVDIEATGTRDQMFEALEYAAAAEGITPEWDKYSILRAFHNDKPKGAGIEHFLVASPVSMTEGKWGGKGPVKQERFNGRWMEAVREFGRKKRRRKKRA